MLSGTALSDMEGITIIPPLGGENVGYTSFGTANAIPFVGQHLTPRLQKQIIVTPTGVWHDHDAGIGRRRCWNSRLSTASTWYDTGRELACFWAFIERFIFVSETTLPIQILLFRGSLKDLFLVTNKPPDSFVVAEIASVFFLLVFCSEIDLASWFIFGSETVFESIVLIPKQPPNSFIFETASPIPFCFRNNPRTHFFYSETASGIILRPQYSTRI